MENPHKPKEKLTKPKDETRASHNATSMSEHPFAVERCKSEAREQSPQVWDGPALVQIDREARCHWGHWFSHTPYSNYPAVLKGIICRPSTKKGGIYHGTPFVLSRNTLRKVGIWSRGCLLGCHDISRSSKGTIFSVVYFSTKKG